jgi:hypothetical protein
MSIAQSGVKIPNAEEALPRLFLNRVVYIKCGGISIQAESVVINGTTMKIKVHGDIDSDSVIVYVRHGEKLVFSHAKIIFRSEKGELQLEPQDLQAMDIPRKEERVKVAGQSDTSSGAYVTKIISDFSLKDGLSHHSKMVEAIKDELTGKLKGKYTFSKMVFSYESSNDPRMDYFASERQPLFIKDISVWDGKNDDTVLKRFMTKIHPYDSSFSANRLISEISVPFLYRYMLPFGYLQVNGVTPFNDEDYSALKKMGMSVSTIFSNDTKMITSSDDRILVSDLSMHGLGIFFKDKPLIKHFKDDHYVIFTVCLPDGKQATMMCVVRNIGIVKNSIYRVGCEIINIDPIGEVHYSEFIESGLS